MRKNLIFITILLFWLHFGDHGFLAEARASAEDALSRQAYYPVSLENTASDGSRSKLIFFKKPSRVIAVGQNAAETMLALGLSESVAAAAETVEDGRILRKLYPQAFEPEKFPVRPRIDKETMLMLEPDLIIAWQSRFTEKLLGTTSFWHQRGVMAYIPPSAAETLKPKTLDLEYQYILELGKIFNEEAKAEKLVSEMELEIQRAAKKSNNQSRQTVLILAFSRDLIISYGPNSLPGDIVEKAGGTLLETPRYISYEELLNLNPDVMFVVRLDSRFDQAEQAVLKNKMLRSLDCVKNKRVHALSVHWLYNSSVNSAAGIKAVIKGLYGGV
jgi:iron complex transport system substrate-binding protein